MGSLVQFTSGIQHQAKTIKKISKCLTIAILNLSHKWIGRKKRQKMDQSKRKLQQRKKILTLISMILKLRLLQLKSNQLSKIEKDLERKIELLFKQNLNLEYFDV